MSEQFKPNDFSSSAPEEQDVAVLIKKMQQQLVLLEKKIDTLIDQSSRRPFGEKHFSKPFRPFDRAHGDASGEKRFDRARHFEKRPSEENRGFGYKKKVYGEFKESNFGQERNFARRNDGPKEGFDKKKKPFPYKRRERG